MSMADSKKPKLQFLVEESSLQAHFPAARPMEKRQQEQNPRSKTKFMTSNKSISNINKIIDKINNEISELKIHIEVAAYALLDFNHMSSTIWGPFKFLKPIIKPRKSLKGQTDALTKHIIQQRDILSSLHAERAALEYRLLEMERLLTKIQYHNYSGQAT